MAGPSPLIPGKYYHIYNRGTDRNNLYVEKRNYTHFLNLYAKYVDPLVDTFAYSLLKNHFHLLIRIKDHESNYGQHHTVERNVIASNAFSNLFNAYAKAFNKAYNHTGSLFQHPFGRVLVESPDHFWRLVRYIHLNSQSHGLVSDFRSWPHSSFRAHLSNKPTRLRREEVLAWFDGVEGFLAAHQTLEIDDAIISTYVQDDLNW